MNDKQLFVKQLEKVLMMADSTILSVTLIDVDTVEISWGTFNNKKVNIACNSKMAIIEDVVRRCF